jgi:hypothetical protein
MDNIILTAALRLAGGGTPVFPCAKSNKCPCTPHALQSTNQALQPKPRPIAKSPIRIPDHRALAGIIRAVAGAAEGTRNTVLFWAGCRAGEMVGSGLIAVNTAVAILTEAALRAGVAAEGSRGHGIKGDRERAYRCLTTKKPPPRRSSMLH